MSRRDDLQQLIVSHQRRLQKLKEQQASFGLYTPPYILMEIENIEAELTKLQAELARLRGSRVVEELLAAPVSTGRPGQIFISYSRRDKTFVERLAADLERAGFVTWWDVSKLVGGEVWTQTIEAALKQSQCCLVVLSPNSVKAEWVRKEYLYAMQMGLEIIPILYKPCETPLALTGLHYLDLCGNKYEQNLQQLLLRLDVSNRRPELDLSSFHITHQTGFKEKLLTIIYRPRWQMIGVALATIILLALGFYIFYTDSSLVSLSSTSMQMATTIAIETTTTSPTSRPVPPTTTPVSPTYTSTPLPPTATPTPTSLPSLITDDHSISMILVPAGPFEMGMSSDSGDSDEQPIHTVILDDFYIDQYEVTNAQYTMCVDAGLCDPPSDTSSYTRDWYYGNPVYDGYPVIRVNWQEAKAYCEWRGAKLPTEAEWSKAARGTNGRVYPWGDTFNGTWANFCDSNCNFEWANADYDDGYADTAPVGSYPAGVSPYGVYDMAGNVWEWVADWYDGDYYARSPSENPQGPDLGRFKVLRGGSWHDTKDEIRAANRNSITDPLTRHPNVGFRCVSGIPE